MNPPDSLFRGGRAALVSSIVAMGAAVMLDLRPIPAAAYTAITPSAANRTITLTGHDLSIDDIVAVARYGAKVQLSPAARQREADNYGLLLEATREGIPVYWFNRGTGAQRETVLFEGDATSPTNKPKLEAQQLERFRLGALAGFGPEVDSEEIVRATLVVRANAMTFNAPSPQLSRMLIELINRRITPVMQSRGTVGEGDLAQLANVAAVMVGAGEAYYQGVRMPAAQALSRAGLEPLQPFAADENALTSSNAYATGQAALIVNDARRALEWADLVYAMDLNGMNSSITPLSLVVQCDRPGQWLNWDAARVLDMLKGSYLFNAESRIIQDPESLRASSIRAAAAWEEWAALRDAVLFQANSSDHNPAVHVGMGPEDSWELATPQMLKFFVKGGPQSHGQHGYIVSNANWDPYPMANKTENFVIALANLDVAVMLRIDRFTNPFFTAVESSQVHPDIPPHNDGYTSPDLQQEIQSLINPVAPSGSAIKGTVEDLQAQTRIKMQRARQAVSTTLDLLSHDLLQAAFWLDVRQKQDSTREFGAAATAVWSALRRIAPLQTAEQRIKASKANTELATEFVHQTDPEMFYSGWPPPAGPGVPPTNPRRPSQPSPAPGCGLSY